jgi:hypothetical protein
MLTADDIHDAFAELGALAASEGHVIDIAVYGGSALMLVSNFRAMSEDVDAVASDRHQGDLERLAKVVAHRRGWGPDWLNDDVFPFLSDRVSGVETDHALLRSYPADGPPGLRVFVPTAEYMCALKLMALRIDAASGAKDLADLRHLTSILGLDTPAKALELVRLYYGRGEVAGRVEHRVYDLYQIMESDLGATRVSTPAYLGRGRPPDGSG